MYKIEGFNKRVGGRTRLLNPPAKARCNTSDNNTSHKPNLQPDPSPDLNPGDSPPDHSLVPQTILDAMNKQLDAEAEQFRDMLVRELGCDSNADNTTSDHNEAALSVRVNSKAP